MEWSMIQTVLNCGILWDVMEEFYAVGKETIAHPGETLERISLREDAVRDVFHSDYCQGFDFEYSFNTVGEVMELRDPGQTFVFRWKIGYLTYDEEYDEELDWPDDQRQPRSPLPGEWNGADWAWVFINFEGDETYLRNFFIITKLARE